MVRKPITDKKRKEIELWMIHICGDVSESKALFTYCPKSRALYDIFTI